MVDKKKKDPEIIIELDKQIKYIEKSIAQLKNITTKNHGKAKENIKKRTKENTDLIEELSALRTKAEERKKEMDELEKTQNKNKLAKQRLTQEIEKLQVQIRRAKRSRHEEATEETANNLFNRPKTGEDNRRSQCKYPILSHSLKARGKLIKGPMFNNKPAGVYKQKIAELMAQLEENN